MDDSAAPLIHFLPDPFRHAPQSLMAETHAMATMSLPDIMCAEHTTDAHFVTYHIPGDNAVPRLSISLLGQIRAQGFDVAVRYLVVEYDNPTVDGKHRQWSHGEFDAFFSKLIALDYAPATNWAVLYATRGGCRWVYALTKNISVEEASAKTAALIEGFTSRGIALDPSVTDWTRLWRLPHVVRDKKPTTSEVIPHFDQTIDPDTIPAASRPPNTLVYVVEPHILPKPDEDEARGLLFIDGGRLQTDFYTLARRQLKNRECSPCIFDAAPLAPVGHRGSTLQKYVGQAVAMLYSPEIGPEHIYALFLDAILQLTPAPDVDDWTTELWSACGKIWNKEAAQSQAKAMQDVKKVEKTVDLLTSIACGMARWNTHPGLLSPDRREMALAVERHMIATSGPSYYLMRPDGFYDPLPICEKQLIAVIRSKGMDGIIQTTRESESGVVNDRPIQHLISQYATICTSVWSAPAGLDITGGMIRNVNTSDAEFRVPSYHRNPDLIPVFDTRVDTWLRLFAGKNYHFLEKWLAYAPAIEDGAICALSIKGAPGIGKKMLAHGLSEILKMPAIAGGEDLVGTYNYGLLNTPFLFIDEGLPKGGYGRHPADQFRSMVSGDKYVVNRKYMAPVNCSNPLRIICGANNSDIIKALCAKREMSPEDRAAIAIRMMHLECDDAAAVWLADNGGHKFTTGWIRGDMGHGSQFVVARHILWLYSRRAEIAVPGGRFLVEGNMNQSMLFEMRTQSGSSPLIIETILRMLESSIPKFDGMAIVDGRLFVSTAEVLNFFRQHVAAGARRDISTDQIANVFRGLSVRECEEPYVLPTREHVGKRRWHELDCGVLLEVARKDGFKCDKLAELVTGVAGKIEPIRAVG